MKNFLFFTTLILIPLILSFTPVFARDFGGLFPVSFQLNPLAEDAINTPDDLVDCDLDHPSKDPDCRELQQEDNLPEQATEPPSNSFLTNRYIDFTILVGALQELKNRLNGFGS